MALSSEGTIALIGLILMLPSVYLASLGLMRCRRRRDNNTWLPRPTDVRGHLEHGYGLNVCRCSSPRPRNPSWRTPYPHPPPPPTGATQASEPLPATIARLPRHDYDPHPPLLEHQGDGLAAPNPGQRRHSVLATLRMASEEMASEEIALGVMVMKVLRMAKERVTMERMAMERMAREGM